MFALILALSAASECSVAVLTVEAAAIEDKSVIDALTESVATGAREASGCKVITPKDVRSMLAFEADRQACASDDASCIAEIGAALGVERIVTTSVHKLGSTWTASVRLLDIKNATVLEGRERVIEGNVLALRGGVRELGRSVFGAWSPLKGGLVLGGAGAAAAGLGFLAVGGMLFASSTDTLDDPRASGDEKDTALALYDASIVSMVVGAIVLVAGAATTTAGLVIE